MKIIYAGIQRENYNHQRGWSFEYVNFYLTLRHMRGVEVTEFPFDRILEVGRKRFNEELWQLVRREAPDLLFVFMYTDELDPAVLDRINRETKTVTIGWFADDYWRYWNYSRRWAPHFRFTVTTYRRALEWYRRGGYKNALYSQWASNDAVYRRVSVPQDIDVSFVGQYKPPRAKVIEFLKGSGITVEAFGFGWPNGKLSHDDLLNVIGRSKISLNLNMRPSRWSPRVLARLFFRKSLNYLRPDFHLIDNIRAYLHFAVPHTHARPFELAGSGAFVISGYSEGLEEYYEENKEMVFFRSREELAGKIHYYLAHDEERKKIAEAGYQRTMRHHTYKKRFETLFAAVGLI